MGDVEIDDNPYLHRNFLQIVEDGGLWWLSNVGTTLTATVADKKGLFQAWLNPGARIPLALERLTVWFTAGPTTYDFDILVDSPAFTSTGTEEVVEDDATGETTVGRVSFTPDQKLLIVALAEPFLRRGQAGRGPDPVVGRRRRAAGLEGHEVQPKTGQCMPEGGRCWYTWTARGAGEARQQPQGEAGRARAVDPSGDRARPGAARQHHATATKGSR